MKILKSVKKNRLLLIVLLSMVIMITVLHTSIYFLLRDALESHMMNTVKGVATAAAKVIENDVERYLEFLEHRDITSDYYIEKNKFFAEIKEAGSLAYVYTTRLKDDGTHEFIICGAKIGEKDDGWSAPGDDDDWDDGKQMVYETLSAYAIGFSDEEGWGELIIAYAPVFDRNGEVVSLLGVDISGEYFYTHLNYIQTILFAIYGILLIVVMVVVRQFSKKISGTRERIALMLDTSPLCAQIWGKDLRTIDCNEAGVKLYGFKDKAEYTRRFINECSPEYQPDGQSSSIKAVKFVHQAFDEGYCKFEWMHVIPDTGELIPAEVTLVRGKYGEEDVVMGYTRDLREQYKILEGIKQKDNLLQAVNRASALLLNTHDTEFIEVPLAASMELIGLSIKADRLHIWKNELINGEHQLLHMYEWLSDVGHEKSEVSPSGVMHPFGKISDWYEKFLRNEYIGGPFSALSIDEQEYFKPFDIKSVVLIPLFLGEEFWGLFSIDDCTDERDFSEDEIAILRSVSLMMASAINRHAIIEMRTNEISLQAATLSTLFDSFPDLIFTKDLDFRFKHCNKAFLEYFGKSMDDFAGKTDEDCFALPEDKSKLHNDINQKVISNKEIIVFEEFIPRVDGTNLLYERTRLPLMMNNEVIGILGIARDITQRKEQERKMAASYEYANRLRNALSRITMSPAISSGDLQTAVDLISQAGCHAVNVDLVGVWRLSSNKKSLKCITSYNFTEGRHINQDDYDLASFPQYHELLKTERLIVMNNYKECERLAGNESLSAALDAPLHIDGELYGVICIEQKSSEAFPLSREWRIEEENFVSSLADLTALAISGAQRRKAREDAERANQSKSDFIANISHEIRTPMNVIMGLTELMLDDDEPIDDMKEYLEKVRASGVTLTGIINDILDISKIESGKFTLTPAKYELASMLNDITTFNLIKIDEKPITFKFDIDSNLYAYLYGDDLRVKQILNNLLSNAFKYTKEGTVTFTIKCERETDEDVKLTISVKDTGIGIRKEDIDKLFKDYHQVDAHANRKIEGTGLGLSITKKMAELMNGEITMESEYGKGSMFTIVIRQGFVSDELIGDETIGNLCNFNYSEKKKRDSQKIVRADLSYARVLVVDDFVTNLDVAKGMLGKYKMKVDCVTNGPDAIKRIAEKEPHYDAIFMDHMMPGMDGVETTDKIRELGTDYAQNIPIIALTANAAVGNEKMFLDKGFQAFLSKPINIIKMDAAIREWIMKPDDSGQLAVDSGQLIVDSGQVDRRSALDSGQLAKDDKAAEEKQLSTDGIPGVNMRLGRSLYEDDEEMFIDILTSFAENIPFEIEKLHGVNEENLSDYAIDIHTVKGASSSIGAKGIAERAKAMEFMAKDGNLAGVLEVNEQFIKDAEALVKNVQAWLDVQ
jgi:PAS domain S-box-containing protein